MSSGSCGCRPAALAGTTPSTCRASEEPDTNFLEWFFINPCGLLVPRGTKCGILKCQFFLTQSPQRRRQQKGHRRDLHVHQVHVHQFEVVPAYEFTLLDPVSFSSFSAAGSHHLHNILYYRVGFFTRESNYLLQSRILYYRVEFFIT